jgi:hypothetical protein
VDISGTPGLQVLKEDLVFQDLQDLKVSKENLAFQHSVLKVKSVKLAYLDSMVDMETKVKEEMMA